MALARLDTPLKRIMRDEGRTQAWLARRLGVHKNVVMSWIHGIYEPTADNKARVAEVLGREVSELWGSGHGTALDVPTDESSTASAPEAA